MQLKNIVGFVGSDLRARFDFMFNFMILYNVMVFSLIRKFRDDFLLILVKGEDYLIRL